MTLRDHILSMASRTTGVRADEVGGFPAKHVAVTLTKLAAAGSVHRAKVSHKHARFFTHAGLRDTFMEQVKFAQFTVKHDPANRAPRTRALPALHATWPADAVAIVPAHVKVQHCPTYTPRFQEHVLPWVHTGLRCG